MRFQKIPFIIVLALGLVFSFQNCDGGMSTASFRQSSSSSTNNRITLTLPAGFTNGDVRSLTECPSGKKYVSFGAYGTGAVEESRVYWMQPSGASGKTTLVGRPGVIRLQCAVDSLSGGDILYAFDFTSSSIKKSTDNGMNWSSVSTDIGRADEVFMNRHGDVAELTAFNVFRISKNFGESWVTSVSPFSSPTSASISMDVNRQGEVFAASRTWQNTEIVGDTFLTVKKRSTSGLWSTVDTFSPGSGLDIIRIESFHISESGRILLLVNAFSSTDTTGKTSFFLRKSDDNGLTWTTLTGDFLNSPGNSTVYGSRLSPNGDIWYVVSGASGFVTYRSLDGGTSWISSKINSENIISIPSFEVSPYAGNEISFAYGAQNTQPSGPSNIPAPGTSGTGSPYLIMKSGLVGR